MGFTVCLLNFNCPSRLEKAIHILPIASAWFCDIHSPTCKNIISILFRAGLSFTAQPELAYNWLPNSRSACVAPAEDIWAFGCWLSVNRPSSVFVAAFGYMKQ